MLKVVVKGVYGCVILPILCQTIPNPIKFSNTETSILFEWNLNDNYYTEWIINRPNGDKLKLIFKCTSSSTLQCIYNNTDSTVNQLFGTSVNACINGSGNVNCDSQLNPIHYPTPIIKSIIPDISINGMQVIVSGSFLKFVTLPNYYEINGSNNKIMFSGDTTLQEFNPTNVTLNFPNGCGGNKSIKLPNGNKIPFNYQKTIISSSKVAENTIEINGNNICQDESTPIQFNGKPIVSTNLINSEKVIFNISQEYSSSGIPIIIGNSDPYSIVFPPIVTSYDPFCGLDGKLVIHGKRLKSENPKSQIIVTVENTNCVNVIGNTTFLTCELSSGYDKDLIVKIDNIPSDPIMFYYGQPIIYNTTMDKTKVIIKGFCFYLTNVTAIKVGGNNLDIKSTPISNSMISFDLDASFYGKTDIIITNNKYSVSTSVTPSLYAKVIVNPNVDEKMVQLEIYYFDPTQNTLTCDGKQKLTGNGIGDYTFEINPICGTINVTVSDGTNKFTLPVTSSPGKINSCNLLENGTTLCTGSFLASTFTPTNNGIVHFSGKSVPTTFLNSTSFMFDTSDDMTTGDINLDSCTLSTTITYNLNPVILSYEASEFSKSGGIASFTGKYFVLNSPHLKITNCGNQSIPCSVISHTTIDCPISINGPYDKKCTVINDNNTAISIGNQSDGSFIVSFSAPLPLASTSVGLNGGSLIIYGENFYKTNDPFLVSIGNITCDNPILIDDSNIQCTLTPINSIDYPTIFDDLLPINITIAGKSGISPIFSYSRNLITSTVKDNFNSMFIITAIVILIGLIIAYLQFIYYYKKNRNDFISNYKLIKKQCKKTQYTRPQLQIPETRSQSFANY
ncbi:hypothetical protein ACTA71_005432 [Dictyostelium dimigraforme]